MSFIPKLPYIPIMCKITREPCKTMMCEYRESTVVAGVDLVLLSCARDRRHGTFSYLLILGIVHF